MNALGLATKGIISGITITTGPVYVTDITATVIIVDDYTATLED